MPKKPAIKTPRKSKTTANKSVKVAITSATKPNLKKILKKRVVKTTLLAPKATVVAPEIKTKRSLKLTKTWKIVLIVLLFLSLGLGVFGLWFYYQIKQSVIQIQPDKTSDMVISSPTPNLLKPYNVLVAGYGGANHDGGKLTDTIIVAQVNPITKVISLLSIPRDVWIPLELEPGKKIPHKINAAYAIGSDDEKYPNKPNQYTGSIGGYNMMRDAIELATNLKIHHFVAINFDQFREAIDALGGIDVYVDQGFEDKFYPIKGEENNSCGRSDQDIANLTATMSGYILEQQFPCRYEILHFEKGVQTMDGAVALKFVRSRHSDTAGNDFNRSKRQQAVISAIKDEILQLENVTKLVPFLTKVSKGIETTIDVSTGMQMLQAAGNPKDYTFRSIQLNTDNVLKDARSSDRQYILIPKSGDQQWTTIHRFVEKELSTPVATQSAKPN